MTADESCLYKKPWSSSFSSQPHSQGLSVSIGGNVVGLFLPSGNASSSRAKCTARLSCHCPFLLETSSGIQKRHNGHLNIYYAYFSWQKKRNYWNEVGLFLPCGTTSSGRVKFAAGLSCHCLFPLETSFWHPKTTKFNLFIWNSLTVRRSLYFNGHNLQTRLWMLVLATFISRLRDQVQRWRIYRGHYMFLGNYPPTSPQRQHKHLILT